MANSATWGYQQDQRFFSNMALGLAAFIFLSFAQWSARGFVNFRAEPIWVHLHAIAFFGWLALFVAQNQLAERGSLTLHRRLGRIGGVWVVLMVIIGCYATIKAVELHRKPPFFGNAYFLALGPVDVLAFAAMVAAGMAKRRDTHWHRRLMLGATVLLMEPALGRILPPPLFMAPLPAAWLGDYGSLFQRLIQLATLGIAMRHDQRVLGFVHPALNGSAMMVLVCYALLAVAVHVPVFAHYADHLAGG